MDRRTVAARYALGLAIVYFLGIANRFLFDGKFITAEDVLGGLLATLILVNPVATVITGALLGYRYGTIWLFPPLAGLAFVPAVFVVYNDSAFPYALAYMVFAALGMLAGAWFRRAARRRAAHGLPES